MKVNFAAVIVPVLDQRNPATQLVDFARLLRQEMILMRSGDEASKSKI